MAGKNIISQAEALKMVGDPAVSFVDGSWYLPVQGRNGADEFARMRVPGAVFFDIDKIADRTTDLPHMLPTPQEFAHAASMLGISHDRPVIVYDGPGLMSAPRVWWTLKTMGARDVRVLEDGFDGWRENMLPVETGNPNPPSPHIFNPDFSSEDVISMEELTETVKTAETVIIDARPIARFEGRAPEPRAGLRSGHIPGSKALPYTMLLDDKRLKPAEDLDEIFTDLGIGPETSVVTTCGSGVTAAILALALEETGRQNYRLFDGSWAQWGQPDGPEVET